VRSIGTRYDYFGKSEFANKADPVVTDEEDASGEVQGLLESWDDETLALLTAPPEPYVNATPMLEPPRPAAEEDAASDDERALKRVNAPQRPVSVEEIDE
jgi:hypothetical protein